MEGIRIRCATHNQFEAECVFGAGFMSEKRAEARARAEARKQAKARDAAAEARTRVMAEEARTRVMAEEARTRVMAEEARTLAPVAAVAERSTVPATGLAPEPATESSNDRDVTPYLRKLGCTAVETRRVAALCESIPNASLEERVRFALKHLMPPHRRVPAGMATAT